VKFKVVNGFCPKIAPIRHRFIRQELSGLLIEESKKLKLQVGDEFWIMAR
jgi:hypothetical protein